MWAIPLLWVLWASVASGSTLPCPQARKAALHDGHTYIPQCEDSGSYAPLQCHYASGTCWCVDALGHRKVGILHVKPEGHTAVQCAPTGDDMSKEKAFAKAEKDEQDAIALAKTALKEERTAQRTGRYTDAAKAAHDADLASEKAINAAEAAAVASEELSKAEGSLCMEQRRIAQHASDHSDPNSYVPQCTKKGQFSPLQCHYATRTCWCVDSTGHRIPGERQVEKGGYSAVVCPSSTETSKDGDTAALFEMVVSTDEKKKVGGKGGLGPAWTRTKMEAPAGEKNMGTWTAKVYTKDQQKRLHVDENGKPQPKLEMLAQTPDAARSGLASSMIFIPMASVAVAFSVVFLKAMFSKPRGLRAPLGEADLLPVGKYGSA